METPESIRTSLIPGEWVSSIDLSDAYLHILIHPLSRKYLRFCHRSQVLHFTSLPFGLATAPKVFTMIIKEVKLMALPRRLRLHQYLVNWLIRSESQEEHSGSGRSNPILGVDHKSGKIRTESYSGVFVRWLRVPPRFSPCKTHSREMAQTSGFDPTTQVKTCFDCKMFDVSNWIARLDGENGPRGMAPHEALPVSPQGALEISSVTGQPPSLDRSHLCTPRLVAESYKRDERLRPSFQRPQYPTLYRRLKRRLGRSLRAKLYQRSVVTPRKKASHKCPGIESCLSGPETLQRPVSGQLPQLRAPQQSATSQPPRLVSRSGQLQEQGFSVEVAERIAAPQRSSTRTIYKSKWALLEKWCRENSLDFSTPSVKQISDFFMYLYQDLNRCPSTIAGYRTAIVDTLSPSGQHIAQNEDLHRLLSSFHRDHPKSSRNLPKWNFSVVLNELTKAPMPQQNPCLGRKQSIKSRPMGEGCLAPFF